MCLIFQYAANVYLKCGILLGNKLINLKGPFSTKHAKQRSYTIEQLRHTNNIMHFHIFECRIGQSAAPSWPRASGRESTAKHMSVSRRICHAVPHAEGRGGGGEGPRR